MSQISNFIHLPGNHVVYRHATLLVLIFLTDCVHFSASGNNFQSVHRTKEAETRINELYCFKCDTWDGEDCININQTRTKQVNLTKKCSADELYCSVKRFSYTMSDKNSTSEKKLWTLQRDCRAKCENACIIIGERLKIHACETCCQNNLCNVGSFASKMHIDPIIFLLLFIRDILQLKWIRNLFSVP